MSLQTRFAAFERDFPEHETVHEGRRWRYRVGGDPHGRPVLVLTGATTLPDPLFVVIAELGRRHRVIAPAYPPVERIDELVAGLSTVLDAEHVTRTDVVGSSFGGYLAQSLVLARPDRVDRLVLAQTGVRHFVGPVALTSLRWVLQLAPSRVVKAFTWRTWQALLADLGSDGPFWTTLLRDILERRLTKRQLLAVMAAMADFTAHHRPRAGRMPTGRPVLVLVSEHDRAFARQAAEMRAVYPDATFRTLAGAGHGALFTHTDEYVAQIEDFLERLSATSGDVD